MLISLPNFSNPQIRTKDEHQRSLRLCVEAFQHAFKGPMINKSIFKICRALIPCTQIKHIKSKWGKEIINCQKVQLTQLPLQI